MKKQTYKYYVVRDQFTSAAIIESTSPRQAVLAFARLRYGIEPGKLFKIYNNSKDGETVHTGYGFGQGHNATPSWCTVGEYIPMRRKI